ncbi:MAG: hypothetical protein WCZ21_02440 [Bacteroidales bacterium]
MKKHILILVSLALCIVFATCEKPEPKPESKPQPEPGPVTLTFSEKIIIDLGSSDENVLEFVTASDNSAVSVSGIDYDKAGEQEGTFKTGDVRVKKKVYVKTDKLAGDYELTIDGDPSRYSCSISQSATDYNKIRINGDLFGIGSNFSVDAFGQGDTLTMEEFNFELEWGEEVPVTGVGSFEKLESGVYQVKEMTLTVTFAADDKEVFELTFMKQ